MKACFDIDMKTIFCTLLSFFTFFLFVAFSFSSETEKETGTAEISGDSLISEEVYKILPGDTLKITIYNDEELSGGVERLIGEDGIITIPYVDVKVKVTGLSKEECKQEIRKRLIEEEMYIDPNLDVAISKFGKRTVQVTGLVEKPGEIPFEDGKSMAIDEAIAKAGGFSRDKRAARNKVRLTRNNKEGRKMTYTIRVDDIMQGKAKQVFLQPGDIIEVPESIF